MSFADAKRGLRHVFIHGLKINASIGIFDHEKTDKQTVIVNVDIAAEEGEAHNDDIDNVVDYKKLVDNITAYVEAGHILLVETMAEEIAKICLVNKPVKRVLVKIEKPDAFSHVGSVGVSVERCQN